MLDRDLQKISYLVVVKVLEARDLKGETSSINPYVKITCGNLDSQQTKTIEKTSYAIWNQSFTFSELQMNKWELETLELNFEVHDQYRWLQNSLIGSYSIGLSTMFRHPNSDLYKKWLRLSKPETPTNVVGYLQVSCFIVGPGQEPPVHDGGDMEGDVEPEQQQMLRDGVNPDVIFEKQKQTQGLWVVQAPINNWINYQLMVNIYKGENLVKLYDEETNPSSFLSVRTQGISRATRVVKSQDKPNWSQKIYIPIYVPTWNDKIKIVCWHQAGEYMPTDEFMANVPEQPSAIDLMNIGTLHVKEGRMEPTWFNMYGVRPKEWKSGMSRLHASAFMGRVLMSLHLIQNDRPQLLTSSGQAPGLLVTQTYKLWIDVFELVNCDELMKQSTAQTKVTMQAYLNGKASEKSKAFIDSDTNTLKFTIEAIPEIEQVLPHDPNQIPDLFININLTTYAFPAQGKNKKKFEEDVVESNERLGFIRIKGKELIVTQEQTRPTWHVVQSLTNRKKNIGRLLVNARLKQQSLPFKRQHLTDSKDVQYWFFPQIFCGYELAPNIPEEDLITFLKISIGTPQKEKKKAHTDRKAAAEAPKSEIRLSPVKGRFPTFSGSGYIKKPYKVILNDEAAFAKDMCVQLFHQSNSKFSGSSKIILGSFLVPINSMVGVLYKRPQYFTLIDPEGNIQGKILARFFLMKRDQGLDEDRNKEQIFNYMQKINQEIHTVDIKVSVLGVRQLLNLTKDAEMKIYLTNSSRDHGSTIQNAYADAQKKDTRKSKNETDDEENQKKSIASEAVIWNRKGHYYQIKMLESTEDKATSNPNFGRYFAFERVKLKRDMLLWPNLVINLFEQGMTQKATHHLVLPTFLFADFLLESSPKMSTDIKISLAMLMLKSTYESQKQENPLMIYKELIFEQIMSKSSEDMNTIFSLKMPQTTDEVFVQLSQTTAEKTDELHEVIKIFKFDDDQRVPLVQPADFEELEKLGDGDKSKTKDDVGSNDGEGQAMRFLQHDYDQEADDSSGFEEDEFTSMTELWRNFKQAGTMRTQRGDRKGQTIVKNLKADNAASEDEIELIDDMDDIGNPNEDNPVQDQFQLYTKCQRKDKKSEKLKKEARLKDMRFILDKLRKISDSLKKSNADFKEQIRYQMMIARTKIEELENGEMTEELFEAHLKKEEEKEKFDYGNNRKLSRKPLESQLNEFLPYISLNLLQNEYGMMSTTDNYCIQNCIFSSGKPVAARLNFAVSLQRSKRSQPRYIDAGNESGSQGEIPTEANIDSDSEENDTPFGRLSVQPYGMTVSNNVMNQMIFHSIADVKKAEEHEYEIFMRIKEKSVSVESNIEDFANEGWKLDMFRPETLEKMTENIDYTLRVFVKAAQNLSAVDNKVRAVRNQLAGDSALSSSDPYLLMRIMGEEENLFFDGYDKVKAETLNPQFFEQQEVQGLRLQEDWRLEIEVCDQAMFRMNDVVIGLTMIDLEQRRWSNRYAIAKLVLWLEEIKVVKQMEEHRQLVSLIKKKERAEKELIDAINKYLRGKLQRIRSAKVDFAKKEVPPTSVEYRPIKVAGKVGAPQGIIELFVDVLDQEEARVTPFQNLQSEKSDEIFEVRLIIWSTREVPPPNGSVMSAQIRATYERTGIGEDPEIKETDVHTGCKNGRAIFNWRMKFEIGNDEFPRLKLQIFDTGMGGAEAVGETTLNLSTSIKLLKKVGTLEDRKIWLPFNNPMKPDSPSGFCLIQMQIFFKEDAENDPVGEAQEEPNKNPKLAKPTEGRGWGDSMSGLGLSIPNIALPDFFGLIKKVIAAALGVMAIFFVMFLILASK